MDEWFVLGFFSLLFLFIFVGLDSSVPPSVFSDSNSSFLDLNDTPSNYSGDENFLVSVTSDGSGLNFIPRTDINAGGGGATTFTSLTDTPNSYSSQSGKNLRVNSGETALQFYDVVNQSCDNNSDCTFSGTISTTLDASFNNIQFDGILSGGDFNYSLIDSNGSQDCPAGQALQSVGNVTSCVSVGGGGSGTTYTSGTPNSIQVDNDSNTISQNFDANLWSRVDPLFPVPDSNLLNATRLNQDSSCDNNADCTITGTVSGFVTDAVFNASFPIDYDTNITNLPHIPSDANIDSNVFNILQSQVPWQDINIADDITVTNYVRNTIFNNSWPVSDTNLLNATRLNQDSSCDNNADCTLIVTGFVTDTTYNAGWPVLDANINDRVRYRQDASCDNNSNCTIPGYSTWVALNSIIPWTDVNVSNDLTVNGYATWSELSGMVPWTDANVANNITLDNLTQITTRSYNDLQDKPSIVTWDQINNVVPWQDVNVADDITVSNYVPNSIFNASWPVADTNLLNAIRLNQDSSCDNNVSCTALIDVENFAFKVSGFGDTGQTFSLADTGGSVELKLFGVARARLYLSGDAQDSWGVLSRNTDPDTGVDLNLLGTRSYFRNYSDGNQHMMYNGPQDSFLPVGGWQSDSAPDYNLDRVTIREDLNVNNDINFGNKLTTTCVEMFWNDTNNNFTIQVNC